MFILIFYDRVFKIWVSCSFAAIYFYVLVFGGGSSEHRFLNNISIATNFNCGISDVHSRITLQIKDSIMQRKN
jgi:hypothetical protein